MEQLDFVAEKNLPIGENFLKGQKYLIYFQDVDYGKVVSVASSLGLSFPIAKTLLSRGFETVDQIRDYIFMSCEKNVFSADLLKDGMAAVDRILKAIENKEKILIAGDYDVDGITSSALLLISLLPLGANINYFLPNREIDGYGLSSKTIKRAVKSGYSLIITVDNGITAIDAANTAHELGIDLIITDHHRPHGELPKALAIVDPNQPDCSYPFKGLPGVGVIFKLLEWIYTKKGKSLPDKAYELLMLGIIADVAPLNGENRFWVKYGLSKVNKRKSYAISLLAQNSKLNKEEFKSLDIGFMIAPQINALGRLSDSRDAVKFLISAEKDDVEKIGKILLEMNESRKKIEKEIYNEIVFKIEGKVIDLSVDNLIIATGSSYPSGVIGLVASKIMHAYNRPTIIFHELPNGMLKGSARSIKSFNIFDALCSNSDILTSFGGHSFAAGVSLKKENLDEFKKRIEEKILQTLTPFDLLPKINIDSILEFSEMGLKLINDLELLEPFGHQNDQPIFYIKNVSLLQSPKLLKDQHVKCMFFSDGVIKPAIFFNRPDLFKTLEEIGDKKFDVAGYVTVNEWEGKRNIQFQGLDLILK